jgi:hypothetical protein
MSGQDKRERGGPPQGKIPLKGGSQARAVTEIELSEARLVGMVSLVGETLALLKSTEIYNSEPRKLTPFPC